MIHSLSLNYQKIARYKVSWVRLLRRRGTEDEEEGDKGEEEEEADEEEQEAKEGPKEI